MRRNRLVCFFGMALLVTATGCAGMLSPSPLTLARKKHNQEAAHEFDRRRDEAEMLSARDRFRRGELPQAREVLEQLLARNPEHSEARQLLDRIKAVEAAPTPTAAGTRDAKAGSPDGIVFSAYNERSGSDAGRPAAGPLVAIDEALGRGDDRAAQAAIDALVRDNPQDPQIPIAVAVLLLRRNQPEQAVGLLQAAAERHPRSAALHRLRGTAHYRLGDYKQAQVAFGQALSLDKSSALSYFLMGCTLAKLGQGASAAAHFHQAELLDPHYGAER